MNTAIEWVMVALEILLGWTLVSMMLVPFMAWVIKNGTAAGMWNGVCEFYYESIHVLVREHLITLLGLSVIWLFTLGAFPRLSYLSAVWLFQIVYSIHHVMVRGNHPLLRDHP